MKYVIFYSWQSDLPNNTNRGFIGDALEAAVEETVATDRYDFEISVDRDTLGVPGSPNISVTLLEKIRSADAFVADVSVVTTGVPHGKSAPNPNVLLELGYAVSALGWDKIVLVCNEFYGLGQELPFDLRQQRRIPYSVGPDHPKAPARKALAGRLRDAISGILDMGKNVRTANAPRLAVSWHHWPLEAMLERDLAGTRASSLVLRAPLDDTESHIVALREEVQALKEVDGSADPNWSSKVARFSRESEAFIGALSEESNRDALLAECNGGSTVIATLCVANVGIAAANDVRVEVALPGWLEVFEKLPRPPERPIAPRPTPPPTRLTVGVAEMLPASPFSAQIPGFLHAPRTRNSACYLKNGSLLYLWADRLLHKHEIVNAEDRLYFIARPNAPQGTHELAGRCFCSELTDWCAFTLVIEIVA
jgi:hypothetical protein